MRKPFLFIACLALLSACGNSSSDDSSNKEEGPALEVFDSREAERVLYQELGVSEVFGYLRIFPDTAQSDTAFLIQYEKIDSLGRKVRSAEYRIDGFMISNTAFQYDEAHRKIASSTIGADGQLKSQNAFSYNDFGQPLSVLNKMGPEGESQMKMNFEYLAEEGQVVQCMVSPEGKEMATFRFSLNEDGKFETCDITRGEKAFRQDFTYDETGKLIEDLMTTEARVIARTKYSYFSNGLKQEKWLIGVGDTLEGILEFKYAFESASDQ